MSIYQLREWMYNRQDSDGLLRKEFRDGLEGFMYQASTLQITIESGNKYMYCPCPKCMNRKFLLFSRVWSHLLNRGFMQNYYIWYCHGEGHGGNAASSSSSNYINEGMHFGENYVDPVLEHPPVNYGSEVHRMHEMVTDAFPETASTFRDTHNVAYEEPNADARKFFDTLAAADQPLYDGCTKGHTKLSVAARMMTLKTDGNISQFIMDGWADLIKDILPDDNVAADSYYEIQKLVFSLGLPSQMIDVCVDNCMLYWKDDDKLQECRFCHKPRYKPQGRGRNKVPYQRMWYLPIKDRLRRLYQSERTAGLMRWHADHSQTEGEIRHPSDAKAWKHFQAVHPDFASEKRNVYLGLCTDGFSPFGMSGRQYSLWPIILTPYNLPPDMCMQREFLIMSILILGPKHPRRSLDVFLQPLIEELKELWYTGARTYDLSCKRNFTMRAVLMWTISDFPAYGMLSGWTTHGRLSCPYCLDRTDAFQLKHGRKTSWFDCHRRFLPLNHRYRRNNKLFKKNKTVRVPPPVILSGDAIEAHIDHYGAESTVRRGGNWHTPANMPDGYGEQHNWHKKSIFWDLPYWSSHLLRHNLDVIHIEKNFFDNIMHTVLNVKGKTKDSVKSRLDLPEICSRSELHITHEGEVPVAIFQLRAAEKLSLFKWATADVKFPDGYVSNLSKCVQGQKFSVMKSHDCHVFMERLFPFAFAELLHPEVHAAITAIGAFFRDLCTRTLTVDVICKLQENIPMVLCNMEQIFPPAFFDVMEHLAVHLPYEAELGGPVHYRWMYPFERFMGYLKGKAKNLARVEGSIVSGSLSQETSHFTDFYFPSKVRTRKRVPKRYDDGGVGRSYPMDGVPNIFSSVGRLGGCIKEVWWADENDRHSAQTEFCRQVRECINGVTDTELNKRKDQHFASWIKASVTPGDEAYPQWFHELIKRPIWRITTAPMYCTRGYVFHTFNYGNERATANYGVCVKGEVDFYGMLQDIIEVQYPGMLGLRCILFKCDWFDPTPGRGVRENKYGVDVNQSRRYNKFEPFILASQAEQVTFVPYPRVRTSEITWLSVVKVSPRGTIVGDKDDIPPMQQDHCSVIAEAEENT
uniref:Transposase-associated domain-containing protein n=1 Tax=Noccaea caerulescens TaxID=107243 RepID=A0A1J3HIY2_NOCCA